ncbi:conserved hypothetical protein [Culex quinquefasciatus]|uniref:Uncharacterized protein n=1 Tax=Culex quinquefasciatus TaxID=7176 RepID=B0W8V4_CULQU|nr:conserved hypothetical protein [Culex quinquefasciatus]|eukprot:XP_001845169.1 conserved hypothetical protein [Culex quinquefasciatus]
MKIFLISTFVGGGFVIYAQAQHLLAQALYLGDPNSYNTSKEDCVWKRGNGEDRCPDADIRTILYTSGIVKEKFVLVEVQTTPKHSTADLQKVIIVSLAPHDTGTKAH